MAAMKWLALLSLALLECSCSTFDDHRALYRPDPLGGYGGPQYLSQTSSAGFRSMPPSSAAETEQPPPAVRPEFRY